MSGPRVALFVTCLVDMFRPSVGFATVKLLEDAGCRVEVPPVQTCCGQPAWNAGDRENAKAIARQVIAAFEGYVHVVVPSGSCAATIARDFERMFAADDPWAGRARALGARTHEITAFLTDVLGVTEVGQEAPVSVTYHDSCSGLRSLGIREQPRRLLASVAGLELREMAENDVCCGFGGTFCVKYPEISNVMAGDKTRHVAATGADLVLAGDLGCLMNLAGKASREGRAFRARHVVEVLAGDLATPPIGEAG
ncbi:MAG TPA: (Fe-S)-binding protein [Amaricoccus sp.]|uniref:(Fe-S)-binding protein n=1 Tax=Amaricoccus sp. TaxID=1872485 RepID=UPI002C7AE8C0|nr:(Fe-S)-binding protein [Amaricoccus sp.]HMQ93378.1 (Fe-S)-binding protein [Amaricoccus sp.]HMR51807.1 (Fe-S)-binding protein [Amaricoccus sp.]HMR59357.1 (Fe-S)-binding protein [Amaricoccus sp.]HMT99139.1 (Fe-S)-binding protein [Amaricoccus sp.]